jgi:UPF0716 protein FxsA
LLSKIRLKESPVPFFLLLFVAVPVAELVVLIKVGTMIGALKTVALVFVTAILGAWLLKQQGLATLLRARQRMNSGELPAQEVAEGLILAAGGAMLLTPGFITDFFGFMCLLPFTRQWLVGQAIKRLTIAGSAGAFSFNGQPGQSDGGQNPFGHQKPFDREASGDIIEGEYRDETESHRDRIDKK